MKILRPLTLVTALGLAVGATALGPDATAEAQRRRVRVDQHWEVLGQKDVSFRRDQDVIAVGRRDGRFERIRLQVLYNDIRLDQIEVVFGNGRSMQVPTNGILLREGQQTNAIDLPGDDRFIRQVVLHYSPVGRRYEGRAQVRVLGLEDERSTRRAQRRRRNRRR